jgi:hypothetical protein
MMLRQLGRHFSTHRSRLVLLQDVTAEWDAWIAWNAQYNECGDASKGLGAGDSGNAARMLGRQAVNVAK